MLPHVVEKRVAGDILHRIEEQTLLFTVTDKFHDVWMLQSLQRVDFSSKPATKTRLIGDARGDYLDRNFVAASRMSTFVKRCPCRRVQARFQRDRAQGTQILAGSSNNSVIEHSFVQLKETFNRTHAQSKAVPTTA